MSGEDPIQDPAFSEPQSRDYGALLAILAEFDRRAAEEGYRFETSLEGVIDFQAASFAALERVLGFLGIQSPLEMQARLVEAGRLGMLWIEGFHAGVAWEQQRGER